MKKLTKLMLVLAQLGVMGGVHAASILLDPSSRNAAVGSTLSYQVMVNFSDIATDGGQFRIKYDSSLLTDANFSYALPLPSPIYGPSEVSYRTDPIEGALIEGVGFDADSFKTSALLGTLSFTVLGTGSTSVTMSDLPGFSFLVSGTGPQWDTIAVSYSGATANLTPAAVPVPAALWLMASGLSALGLGMRRRRS